MTEKIVVGMSGGVDSAVSALLLLEQGFDVSGLFMKNWEEDDQTGLCTAPQDYADAQQVCERLGIPLHAVNFAAEYWDEVFAVCLDEFAAGRTPNPDILCNQHIKFKAFLDYCEHFGASVIATGHYSRSESTDGQVRLLKGSDPNKDQSYFLCGLGPRAMSRVRFPVGELHKSEVCRLAERAGFANHGKKDSTGICFIGERRFKDFLQRFLPAQPGDMQDCEGRNVGRHEGLMYYTLGQRQGLGIGGQRGASEEPWYVLEKDLQRNVLVVGQGHDHPRLFHDQLTAVRATWINGGEPPMPLRCAAKIRYRQADQPCTLVTDSDGQLSVHFDRPQRAVTPGQTIAFYKGDECIGGAIIDRASRSDACPAQAVA